MGFNISNIDFVILCGGQGQRLREVISDVPKVMAPMGRQPFLNILIQHFKQQGAGRFILCTGYKAEMIEDYYRANSQDVIIEFSREEKPLGTGGGLSHARRLIRSDPFVVMNGDSFCPIQVKPFLQAYENSKGIAALAIAQADETKDYGGIVLDGSDRILSFQEKQIQSVTSYVNAGIYCFSQEIFPFFPPQESFMFEYDCFPQWIDKGLQGHIVREPLIDIGTPERYERAKQILTQEHKSTGAQEHKD